MEGAHWCIHEAAGQVTSERGKKKTEDEILIPYLKPEQIDNLTNSESGDVKESIEISNKKIVQPSRCKNQPPEVTKTPVSNQQK